MVQGRTNIRQLVSQLSLGENVVRGEPWGPHRVFSTFRLAWRMMRFGDAFSLIVEKQVARYWFSPEPYSHLATVAIRVVR